MQHLPCPLVFDDQLGLIADAKHAAHTLRREAEIQAMRSLLRFARSLARHRKGRAETGLGKAV